MILSVYQYISFKKNCIIDFMHILRHFIQNYLNSIIYSLGITLGIFISVEELHKFNDRGNFFIFTALIFIILFLENLIAVLKRNKNVEINFDVNDEVNELWHFFYKFLMPFLYYISFIGFSYYNQHNSSITALLILTFFTFFLLFINTRAFFQNIKILESRTHYVYDLIKFLIFFTSINTLCFFQDEARSNLIIASVATILISFVLTMLMIWRIQKIHLQSIIISAISSIIIGIAFAGLNMTGRFTELQVTLGLFFAFYLSVAIIHHTLLGTLTKSVVLEYLIILIVVFAVVYGIT